MADNLSIEQRRRVMQAVRHFDTAPEMKIRKALHHLGLRYRVHRRDLPGTPDIVFPKWKAVVFVHGCFWHDHGCKYSRLPKTRPEYWQEKREGNQLRDAKCINRLRRNGWRVRVVWECELADADEVAHELSAWLQRVKH